MKTLQRNLEINQGSRFIFPIDVKDNGVAAVLPAGTIGKMQVRKTKSPVAELLATLDAYVEIIASTGRVTIRVPSSASTAWTWTHGYYDLVLIYPGVPAEQDRIMEGVIRLVAQVTV